MATTPPSNTIASLQAIVDSIQGVMPPPPPPLPADPWKPWDLLTAVITRPLYTDIKLSKLNEVEELRLHSGRFDMYCPGCKKEATWHIGPTTESQNKKNSNDASVMSSTLALAQARASWLGYFQRYASCTRSGHALCLNMLPGRCEDNKNAYEVTKICQFPTMTDIELGDLKQFDEALSKPMRKEFIKAINCAAHGFSVAACVYYRRIFENILVEGRDDTCSGSRLRSGPTSIRLEPTRRFGCSAATNPTSLSITRICTAF